MHELICAATAELVGSLAKHLPALGASWWKTHVEDRHIFQQQRTVRERGLTTLERLDFAALPRILHQNGYELSQSPTLPREGCARIKEPQGVRNQWAHLSTAPVPAEELYRDADTLSRVLVRLDAGPESMSAVQAAKTDAVHETTSARRDGQFYDPPNDLGDSVRSVARPQW